jgi:hypothetical protein
MSEERLARIENKVDSLAEAMVTMARVEERIVTIFNRMDRYDEAQALIASKLSTLEIHSIKRGVVETTVDRLAWIIAGGFVAAFMAWYFRK